MATVSFDHIGYITAISPGATHHVSWNNAPAQRVWALSVDAMISLKIPPASGATARVEITHVEYREVYNGPGNLEKEIHWWIKNTGTIDASYAIHMATIRDWIEERAMKVLVLSDSGGNIQSVAVPNPELPGKLHLEVEGGPVARELEVDEREIRREDLLGHKGAEAQGRAIQKLRQLLR